MADEVVGKVKVEVHGDTKPLKRDIKQAAKSVDDGVGKDIGTSIADGVSKDALITQSIVDQVDAAEKPAGERSKKVGKAISHGITIGATDDKDLDDAMRARFSRLNDQVGTLARSLGRELADSYDVPVKDLQDRLTQQLQAKVDTEKIEEIGRATGARIRKGIEEEFKNTELDPDLIRGALDDLFGSGGGGGGGLGDRSEAAGDESGKRFGKGFKRQIIGANLLTGVITSVAKVGAIAGLVTTAVKPLATVLTGLTAQVSALGAGLGAVGIVGAGAAATLLPGLVALKLAYKGLDKDAKKALGEQFKTAAGDLTKFQENVRKGLTPALLESVKTFSKLSPEINKFGTQMGKSAGNVAKSLSSAIVGRRADLDTILTNSSKLLERIGTALSHVVGPVISALAKMQPLITKTVDGLAKGIEKFGRNLDSAVLSGKFEAGLNRWFEEGRKFFTGLKNIGVGLFNIFKIAADSAGDFTTNFVTLTEKFADWTKSTRGENTLKKMFDDARPVIHEVWGLLGDIAGLFGESFTGSDQGTLNFVKALRENVIPAIEDLQDLVRQSGMQEALHEFVQQLLELSDVAGGTAMKGFLTIMTQVVKVATDLLDILAPLAGPLLTFVGVMKGMKVARSAFTGLLSLPGMLLALVAPASRATTALQGLTAAQGASGGGGGGPLPHGGDPEGAAQSTGKLARAINGLNKASVITAVAYGALLAVVEGTTPKFSRSAEEIIKGIEDAKKGVLNSLNAAAPGIGQNFWEKLFHLGPDDPAMRTFEQEIKADLGNNMGAKIKGWLAGTGLDFAGVNATKERIAAQFEDITAALNDTGDARTARVTMEAFKKVLEDNGVAAEVYEDALFSLTTQIEDMEKAAREASKELPKTANIMGDFSSAEKAVQSFGLAWDDATDLALKGLFEIEKFVDPKTGRLNKKGLEAKRKIIFEADLDSIAGVDNAIDGATEDKIREVLLNPKFTDENGNPNEAGVLEIQKLVVHGIEVQKEALVKERQNIEDFLKEKPISLIGPSFRPGVDDPAQFAKDAQKRAAEASKRLLARGKRDVSILLDADRGRPEDFSQDVLQSFADKITRLKVELDPEFPDDPAGMQALFDRLKQETPQLLIDISTEQADKDMEALVGKDWENEIKTKLNDTSYIEVNGQLMRLTEDGEWVAVVGTDADVDRANEQIATFVKDKDGKWVIKPSVVVDGSDVDEDMDRIVGKDWQAELKARFPEEEYFEVEGQLLRLTKGPDGKDKWTAVVTAEEETAAAQAGIVKITKGKDGKPYTAKVTAVAVTADAESDLATLARRRLVRLEVVTVSDPNRNDYGSAENPARAGNAPRRRMVLPPPEPISVIPTEPSPSMISMGGPTMGGGLGLGISPLAGGGMGGSLYGYDSRGRFSTNDPLAEGQQAQPNVTINNYYPEPERASDSIAMQLRLARYAMSGV
jgi:hypothetical protein